MKLPYGILIFASAEAFEICPEAAVQTGMYDNSDDMVAAVRNAVKDGYDLPGGKIYGYVQNEADATAIQAAVKDEFGAHIRMFQLTEQNIYSVMKWH